MVHPFHFQVGDFASTRFEKGEENLAEKYPILFGGHYFISYWVSRVNKNSRI